MNSISRLAAQLHTVWDDNAGSDPAARWECVAAAAIGELTASKRHYKSRTTRSEDARYQAFIRTMPCVVCFPEIYASAQLFYEELEFVTDHPMKRAEAAHTGVRGLGQKGPTLEILPLCRRHHTGSKEAHHVLGKTFFEYHGIDREAKIKQLNAGYRRVA